MVQRAKRPSELTAEEKRRMTDETNKRLEADRPRRHQEVLKAYNLTDKEFPISNMTLTGLDYPAAISAAIKLRDERLSKNSSIPSLNVKINGMDKQPQSYSEAIHEKITSKSQGATDVSPLPKAFVSSSPMPGQ
jgi:tRNA nucleotidyltransferase/poly(A) polymerase